MSRVAASREIWGIQNNFQIVVRLQRVRRLVHDVVNSDCSWELRCHQMQEILIAIQGVGAAANSAGFDGFTSVCSHLCERIEPLMRAGYLPIALVAEWAAVAELYLRRPHGQGFAQALVDLLNDPQWHRELNPAEHGRLLCALRDPSD
jgi:hypothetical protein